MTQERRLVELMYTSRDKGMGTILKYKTAKVIDVKE